LQLFDDFQSPVKSEAIKILGLGQKSTKNKQFRTFFDSEKTSNIACKRFFFSYPIHFLFQERPSHLGVPTK
jgi:hypothetical protein